MSHFNKYIHLERSTRNEVQGFISKSVLIQPKMDGSNSSIWVDDEGKIACGSRTREISIEKDNAGFAYYITNSNDTEINALKDWLLDNPSYIIYGEWLGGVDGRKFVGSIKQYIEGGFFIFDVFDTDSGEYIDYDVWYPVVSKIYHRCVPIIARIDNMTWDDVDKYVDSCIFNLPSGIIGEGIVIKTYPVLRDPWGNPQVAKIVRDEWHHNKTTKKTNVNQNDTEKEFVDKFCTPAFVEKEVNKVLIALDMDEIDCRNGKFFGMCMQKVLNELMEENFWDFYRKKKVASVNLAKIKGLAQAAIREYILTNSNN